MVCYRIHANCNRLIIVALSKFATILFFVMTSQIVLSQPTDWYAQKIKPLFAEKCITCHGALRSEAGLRLDAIQFIRAGSDDGSIVDAEASVQSDLMMRVATKDIKLRMPPEDAGTSLNQLQLDALSKWIDWKLPGPHEEAYLDSPNEHWAYQSIVRPTVPDSPSGKVDNPIDLIIRAAQETKGLHPITFASDAVWLRRISFDMSGLPPTLDELTSFVADTSENKRQLFIDRLLAKPTYGERWGRHWMDIWRYSDWDGYKSELRSSQRHIWHWRDWITESLNANKPYDRMVLEMLAGDELAPNDQHNLRATGFLARNYHKSNRDIWLDATVEHTAKAFLGMTLNCAKCHDHKYDPIPQQAYYEFRALFEPHQIRTDQLPGVADIEKDGVPRAYDSDLKISTYLYVRGNEKHPLKESPIAPNVPGFLKIAFEIKTIELPFESSYPELTPVVRENTLVAKQKAEQIAIAKLQAKLIQTENASPNAVSTNDAKQLEQQLTNIEVASSEVHVAMADRVSTSARYAADEAKYSIAFDDRTTKIDQTTELAQQKALARKAAISEHRFQHAKSWHEVLQKQLGLAAAIDLKEEDAKKREATIKTAETALHNAKEIFGKFSLELDADEWSYTPIVKELPRQSTGRRLALAKWIVDSQNPLAARVAINHIWLRHFGSPLVENTFDFGMTAPKPALLDLLNWLAAELIESGWNMKHIHRLILSSEAYAASSDDSNLDLYQKNEATDPDNRYYWRANIRRLDAEEIRDSLLAVAKVLDDRFSGPDIDSSEGDNVLRRSLYFRHAYEKQMPMLVLFDAASPSECYRRKPSLVPQQALALANSSLARRMAKQLAENCFKSDGAKPTTEPLQRALFIEQLFQTVIGRKPNIEEQDSCVAFLESQTQLLSDPSKLTRFSDDKESKNEVLSPDVRARCSLALVLLNHHDFVTIR